MKRHQIEIPEVELHTFCRRHHIKKLAFFGSFIRDDFNPASDIDILVEFEAGYVPGLAFFSMQDELSKIIGHRVDLNTSQFLSHYFRDKVIEKAEVLYDAA